ncbi:hypothetical protein NYE76_01665 [Paenibacillus sp. FSL M7-0831]|uniref:hypothetical protein n=1 Tax=Paenibacillus macerans TaxID=44252 RepID=UPI00056B657C|nr:hypothetical protein [Paenibacillus macerans]MEC0331977.1 hypothetical protein [Paenibacillus macerans]SUA84421.1 Uncharacterised protein [Paenibacillus macerans]
MTRRGNDLELKVQENVVNGKIQTTEPGEKWITEITWDMLGQISQLQAEQKCRSKSRLGTAHPQPGEHLS